MLRIALGGISHETNTYADSVSGPTDLDRFVVRRGDRMLKARGTATFMAGFLDACDEIGAEPVPTLWAYANPSGTVTAAAYAAFGDELLERLAAALPVDAVALELHGAGVVEGIDDLEGELGPGGRRLVGPDVPIVAALDLHGNITDRWPRRSTRSSATSSTPTPTDASGAMRPSPRCLASWRATWAPGSMSNTCRCSCRRRPPTRGAGRPR